MFNTAELLLNQLGLTPWVSHGDGTGLHLLLNHYVEDVQNHCTHLAVIARNTLTGQVRTFRAGATVLAAGSIGSPKLLRRSSVFPWLPQSAKDLVGRGLADHPTSNEITTFVDSIDNVKLGRGDHAKIVFYTRGVRDGGQIRYPFNVAMNLNHEYWHLRDNDPIATGNPGPAGAARIDNKFSFGNCLDENNEVRPAPPFGYVPEVRFRNQSWADYLAGSRFPALAGWQKSADGIWAVHNHVTHQIFSQFRIGGASARPDNNIWYGQGGKGFGWGTVHHAAGSLRMPARPRLDAPFGASFVDENLQVIGTDRLFVCDMSVMPVSIAANPVRTLVAIALRLSRHFK